MQLKWGIVGTGKICYDFCLALLTCDSNEHAIVAVSSREQSKADEFVEKLQLENVRTYGNQEAIFSDANVDIVYIGTIEQYHRDLCVKALNNAKHVLCEKPLGMNANEVQEIIDCARKNQKFFMEAIWSRFFPIYDHLRQAIEQIGTVTFVECTFSLPFSLWSTLMGIGCYVIQAALLAFHHEEPDSIRATGHTKDFQGQLTDSTATMTLVYKNNRMAILTCLGENIEEIHSLKIYGSKGTVSLPTHFWTPTRIDLPNGDSIECPLPTSKHQTNYIRSIGLRYEAIACREQIMKNEVEHPLMTFENSLQIARILDEAREQILHQRQV